MTSDLVQEDSHWPSYSFSENVALDYQDFSKAAFFDSYRFQAYIASYLSGVVEQGGDVLEIGSGPGFLSKLINDIASQNPIQLTVTDHSEHMVNLAKKNLADLDASRCRFKVADAQKLPFESNQFDLVVSQFILRVIPSPQKALLEAFRVVKPGGLVYFTDVIQATPVDRQHLIDTAPGHRGKDFIKAALDSALSYEYIHKLLSECSFDRAELLRGGIGGFTPTSRELIDLVKAGFPLRKLLKHSSSQWSRDIAQYWAHIYIRKEV